MIELKKFIINLKRRDDRLKELNLPFDYTIFDATDGKVSFSDYPVKQQGFMGCWDSHRRLFDKIKEMYEIVFFITHNDIVKDWGDNVITVIKTDNVSKITIK